MIEDADLELTGSPGVGQAITATDCGSRAYDLGAAGVDPAVGEPLQPTFQVTENFNTLTSGVVEVGHADDAAGTNFVALSSSGTITLANLTTANSPMKRLPAIAPGLITKKFLAARFVVTGTNPTLGKIRVLVHKGAHATPVNPGAL
jgi:hypothetical protein